MTSQKWLSRHPRSPHRSGPREGRGAPCPSRQWSRRTASRIRRVTALNVTSACAGSTKESERQTATDACPWRVARGHFIRKFGPGSFNSSSRPAQGAAIARAGGRPALPRGRWMRALTATRRTWRWGLRKASMSHWHLCADARPSGRGRSFCVVSLDATNRKRSDGLSVPWRRRPHSDAAGQRDQSTSSMR